jgi:DNA-binding SARP family transcriptional activator
VLFQVALHCIAERGQRVPRDRVAQWLWPTSPRSHAAQRLRSAVSRLRQLGVPIQGDGHTHPHLWIDRANVRTDDAWLTTAAVHELLQRDLRVLPGYAPRTPAVRDWIDDYRSQIHARIVRILHNHADTARQEEEWELVHALERRIAMYDALLTTDEASVVTQPYDVTLLDGKPELRHLIGRRVT